MVRCKSSLVLIFHDHLIHIVIRSKVFWVHVGFLLIHFMGMKVEHEHHLLLKKTLCFYSSISNFRYTMVRPHSWQLMYLNWVFILEAWLMRDEASLIFGHEAWIYWLILAWNCCHIDKEEENCNEVVRNFWTRKRVHGVDWVLQISFRGTRLYVRRSFCNWGLTLK